MRLSKLCLGTAQLGMDYGINNLTGKPRFEESRAIIKTAVENGITTFDTAPAYGDSEKILGRCLKDLNGECVLISKLPAVDGTQPPQEIARGMRHHLESTLRRLDIARLPVYLFHRFEDIRLRDGLAVMEMNSFKTQGLLEKWGVSIYTPGQADECLEIEDLEIIQVPFNLTDKRLLDNDFLGRAKKKSKIILARSVFLQGLLFKKDLSESLKNFEPYRQKLESAGREEGLDMTELALRYVLSFEAIDSVLIGVETLGQLKDNLRIFDKGGLSRRLLDRIRRMGTASENIIDPRQWRATGR
jgi:aryl-alcohol dehydrogenase-like predicted oxidoreductase